MKVHTPFAVLLFLSAAAAADPGHFSPVFDDYSDRDAIAQRTSGPGLNYSTSFEIDDGYSLGFILNQPSGCSGSPPCWGVSVAANASLREGHVDNVRPHTGAQHLRLSRDPNVQAQTQAHLVAARFPRNEDVIPRPLAPVTFSFDMAVDSEELFIYVQSREQGLLTTAVWITFDGNIDLLLVLDRRTGALEWHIEHGLLPRGEYQRMTIAVNPCENYVVIYHGSNPFYSNVLWNATDVDQIVFATRNLPGHWDIDDFEMVTGEPCPMYGACCDTNGAGRGCIDNVLDANCNAEDHVFHADLTCGQIICDCIPNCVDRSCGPDGCGAFCGTCSNGNVCDGLETCNLAGQCAPGSPLICDDGLFCNGSEFCHFVFGCQTGIAPCAGDQACDEMTDQCLPPAAPIIPTASEWGMLVLSLLLLILSKLRFRQRSFP